MSDLMQTVLSTLDQEQIDAIARTLGASPQQTERAIQAALPLLIAQLARNSAQPQGAQSLHSALETDHAGIDAGDLLRAVLGAARGSGSVERGTMPGAAAGYPRPPATANTGDIISTGRKILGHVFGNKQQRVANGVGQVGGMSGQQSSQLLSMLAPIVMAVLSRMMQKRGGGASGLGGLLGGESQRVQQQGGPAGGLISAVLDRDGDGDVDLSDLMQGGQLLGGLLGRR